MECQQRVGGLCLAWGSHSHTIVMVCREGPIQGCGWVFCWSLINILHERGVARTTVIGV